MANIGLTHVILVKLASWALWSFFREVRILNEDNLPREGAVIVTSTHHNSALDPTVLSCVVPSGRRFHYWVKSSLFKNAVVRTILLNAGNIPVDRDSKDKRKLFQGTFDVLEEDGAVAVFPEGTSYTEPSIVQVKDGAAWSALEYTLLVREAKKEGKTLPPVVIVPAAIVYTNKSKYRSAVVLEFGKPITTDAYIDDYASPREGAARAATKRMTKQIERQMIQMSINAPDWESLNAAKTAREILWEDERTIPLDEFVVISQTLVDVFTTPYAAPQVESLKSRLLTYYALLNISHLTHDTLSSLPLPRDLDPQHTTPLPSRLSTLMILLRDSVASLIRLPFFLLPLLIHMPVYIVAKYVANLVPDEEELAQSKVFLGLFLLIGTYATMFAVIWAFFWLTPIGALFAALLTWGFAVYHLRLVDENYDSAKRLVAAWRVLLGVWAPQSWDIALNTLQLSVRPDQAVNKYLKKPGSTPSSQPVTPPPRKKSRPPSRRLIRHVLRNRVQAAQALMKFLDDLEKSSWRVTASPHLARAYGHIDESAAPSPNDKQSAGPADATHASEAVPEPHGWRSGREVVSFLRARGAKLSVRHQGAEWGALSSGEEDDSPDEEEDSPIGRTDAVWVGSGQSYSP